MAFAIGCRKDDTGKRALEVLHIFEYLIFDLERKSINVCADFLTYNHSDRPARLHVLHRGNVDFQAATDGWSEDRVYTRLLEEIAGKDIALSKGGRNVVLRQLANSPLEAELIPDSPAWLEGWGPERPTDGTYTPCTGFKSPELEPQKYYLFRVTGTIEGESYRHIMHEYGDGKVELKAGRVLWEQIKAEIKEHSSKSGHSAV